VLVGCCDRPLIFYLSVSFTFFFLHTLGQFETHSIDISRGQLLTTAVKRKVDYSNILSHLYLGAATIPSSLPSTTAATTDDTFTEPLTTRTKPTFNTCDVYGALRCLGGVTVSTTGPIIQEITNLTAEHVHNLCM
jgi:hypothetical protein